MKKLKVLATLVAILMMCTAVNFVPAITASAKTVNHHVVSASDEDDLDDEDDSGDEDDDSGDEDDDSGDEDDDSGDEDDDSGDEDDDSGDEDDDDSKDTTIDEGEDPVENDTVYTENDMKTDLSKFSVYQYCGDSLLWYINGTTLVIFGSGKMYDYGDTENTAPWKDRNFDKVIFRNGIEYIGKYAFSNSSVKSITFSSTITEIGSNAFEYCMDLTKVHLNKNLDKLGSQAFLGCAYLKNFTFNNTLSEIGYQCFEDCYRMNYIRFPKTLQTIAPNAFANCTSLKNITLREGLQNIDYQAFYNCVMLEKVQVPKSLVEIDVNSFYNCKNLSDINLDNSVSIIRANAFDKCKALKSLNLGKAVTIQDNAFNESGLTKLTVSKYLTNIGKDIFSGCSTVTVDVNQNAKAYRFFKKLKNVNTVCKVHSNQSSVTKKATFSADGKINGSVCDACGYETAIKTIYQIKGINLSKPIGSYNGKTQYPLITVKDRLNKTISPSNYNVTFAKGFRNVGKYAITVTFKNNYAGKRTVYYKINPPKTKILSLKSCSKGFTFKLNKQMKETSGYQVQYSKNKNFAYSKIVTLNNPKSVKYTVKNLSSKNKYYVRTRTYKKIGKIQYNSDWSKSKTVTVK